MEFVTSTFVLAIPFQFTRGHDRPTTQFGRLVSDTINASYHLFVQFYRIESLLCQLKISRITPCSYSSFLLVFVPNSFVAHARASLAVDYETHASNALRSMYPNLDICYRRRRAGRCDACVACRIWFGHHLGAPAPAPMRINLL